MNFNIISFIKTKLLYILYICIKKGKEKQLMYSDISFKFQIRLLFYLQLKL